MICKPWTKEYVPLCNVCSKRFKSEHRELNVRDLVLNVDESVKNIFYQMARVLEVHPGSDGVVRSFKDKTATEELQRPLVKLALVF